MRCYRQANSGPSAARNFGFRKSTGEFIQFLDSDDTMEPRKIETQVRMLSDNPGIDFCVSNYVRVNADNSRVLKKIDLNSYPHGIENFPAQYPMNTVTPLYRRKIIELAGGYDEQLRAGEDFEFNFRVMAYGKGVWIDSYLVRCRTHDGGERIQAGNYTRWFDSLAMGLVKMNLTAIRKGISSKCLEISIGKKAMDYEAVMRREYQPLQADFFKRHALSWMGFFNGSIWRLRLSIRKSKKQLTAAKTRYFH